MTDADLVLTYAKYNRKFFGGSLPKMEVRWGRLPRNLWAQAEWYLSTGEAAKITLSRRVAICNNLRDITLLHEMAHIALRNTPSHQEGCTDETTHGSEFKAEMRRLAAEGAFDELW